MKTKATLEEQIQHVIPVLKELHKLNIEFFRVKNLIFFELPTWIEEKKEQ